MEAKILKITFNHIDFNLDFKTSREINIELQLQAKLSTPKKADDKTALMRFNIAMTSPDDEKISMNSEASVIFGFSEKPEDYQSIVKETCIPMAQKEIFRRINEILNNLGHRELAIDSACFEKAEK